MKDITDKDIKKVVAQSIGLDAENDGAVLDVLRIVDADTDTIQIETEDRNTFDLIISCGYWPAQRESIADSLKNYVGDYPAERATNEKWFGRRSSIILNDRMKSTASRLPSHARTHEDWLAKGTTLVPVDRLTSVPSHARTNDEWLRHTRTSIVLNARLTSVPSHTDTDDDWLKQDNARLSSGGTVLGIGAVKETPVQHPVSHENAGYTDRRLAEISFADLDKYNTDQRDAWLPQSDHESDSSSHINSISADAIAQTQGKTRRNVLKSGNENAQPVNGEQSDFSGNDNGDGVSFQSVRTSLPPPHRKPPRTRRALIAALASAALVLAVLVGVLIFLKHGRQTEEDSAVVSAVMMQNVSDPETVVAPVSGRVLSNTGAPNAAKSSAVSENSRLDTAATATQNELSAVAGRIVPADDATAATDATDEGVSNASSAEIATSGNAVAGAAANTTNAGSAAVTDINHHGTTADDAESGSSPVATSTTAGSPAGERSDERKKAIDAEMEKLAISIKNCRLEQGGRLKLKFIVRGDGKVISTETVDGIFAGTTTGYCASSAALGIQLPASDKGRYTFYYTFKL